MQQGRRPFARGGLSADKDTAAAPRHPSPIVPGDRQAMTQTAIALDTPVEEVMRRFPATIAVFLRHRMHCVGCAVGPLHTVADSIREYGLVAATLIDELRAAAAGGGMSPRRAEPATG